MNDYQKLKENYIEVLNMKKSMEMDMEDLRNQIKSFEVNKQDLQAKLSSQIKENMRIKLELDTLTKYSDNIDNKHKEYVRRLNDEIKRRDELVKRT